MGAFYQIRDQLIDLFFAACQFIFVVYIGDILPDLRRYFFGFGRFSASAKKIHLAATFLTRSFSIGIGVPQYAFALCPELKLRKEL